MKQLDLRGFDVIALVRGGGVQVEAADDLNVLETVVNLKTPIIAAIGHVEEKLFIKQVVDKEASTPNGLGQYFSEMVESVSEKKTKSHAVLTEKIKKQFKEQIEAGQKQNKELQEKLTKLTKTQEEATKKYNEQVLALTKAQTEATKKHNEQIQSIQKQHKEQIDKTNKQNQELQKKLTELTKTNETAQKAHSEQLAKLQVQLKQQNEASEKQSKEFSESLKRMQETNGELNKSRTFSSATSVSSLFTSSSKKAMSSSEAGSGTPALAIANNIRIDSNSPFFESSKSKLMLLFFSSTLIFIVLLALSVFLFGGWLFRQFPIYLKYLICRSSLSVHLISHFGRQLTIRLMSPSARQA